MLPSVEETSLPQSLRLSPHSQAGLHNTILAMKSFCLSNNLSDGDASDLHNFFDTIVDGNCMPSNYAFI